MKSALMLTPHKTILILTNRWKYFMSIDFSCSKHMLHVIKFTCMPMLPILTSKLGCVKKYARGRAIFASLLKLFLQEFQYICLITAYFRAISDSKIHKARILSSRSGVLRFRQILEGYYGLTKD